MTSKTDRLVLFPIGIIRTPHTGEKGAPIQSSIAKDTEGTVEVFPEYREALSDLAGFERIWLLFWCDRAKPYKLKVVPYRDVILRGLFATRSPSRPNPIGISPVRLIAVDEAQGILKVKGVDMLDGTPILDIKPYVPEFDSHPEVKAGWLDDIKDKRETADGRFT